MEIDLNADIKHDWGIPDVGDWLRRNRKGNYVQRFADNYITGEKLLYHIDEEYLVNEVKVKRLDAQAIVDAIEYFKIHNPDDLYEFSGDEMSDEWDSDADDPGYDPYKDYVPPDQFPTPPAQRRPLPTPGQQNGGFSHHRALPQTPRPDSGEESNGSDYEVSDHDDSDEHDMYDLVADAQPKKRTTYLEMGNSSRSFEVPDGDIDDQRSPFSHEIEEPVPVLPQRPSKPGRLGANKPARPPPQAPQSPDTSSRLPSMPTDCAPGIPGLSAGGKRQRPPAPDPTRGQSNIRPHRPPIEHAPAPVHTTPFVPDGQGLGDDGFPEDNYEETDMPPPVPQGTRRPSLTPQHAEEIEQENYEEVVSGPVTNNNHSVNSTPNSTLPRSFNNRKLPRPPSDDDSGGSFTSNQSGSGGSLPGRPPKSQDPIKHNYPLVLPGQKATKYPLVTLPGQQSSPLPPKPTGSKPSTPQQQLKAPKKYIASYNELTLQQEREQAAAVQNATKPLPNKPLPNKPLPNKPLPTPPTTEKKTPVQRPEINNPRAKFGGNRNDSPPPPAEPEESVEVTDDTSQLSVKERMRRLNMAGGGGAGGGVPPMASKPAAKPRPGLAVKPKADNIMEEMMRKQRERSENNNQSKVSTEFQSQAAKPQPTLEMHKPLKPVKQVTQDKPLPTIPATQQQHKPPQLPPSREEAPALPRSQRPSQKPRRDSTTSTASSASAGAMDEGSLYGYSWYKSDITRTDSLREHLRHHDGAFVVRKSTKVVTKPYTLDVRFENNEFHIPIRQREDGKYAMGNYKEHENAWATLPEMVSYFMTNNISLTKRDGGREINKRTKLI